MSSICFHKNPAKLFPSSSEKVFFPLPSFQLVLGPPLFHLLLMRAGGRRLGGTDKEAMLSGITIPDFTFPDPQGTWWGEGKVGAGAEGCAISPWQSLYRSCVRP